MGCYLSVAYADLGPDSQRYYLHKLHLWQLLHLGPHLGVHLSLVTLKEHRFYYCSCLRIETELKNKKKQIASAVII